jgi:hypothetical protein
MKRFIYVSPVASLAPLIGDGELVAFNVGPDGVAYLVVALWIRVPVGCPDMRGSLVAALRANQSQPIAD